MKSIVLFVTLAFLFFSSVLIQPFSVNAVENTSWRSLCEDLQALMVERGDFLEDGYLEAQRMGTATLDHLHGAINRFSTRADVSSLEADLLSVETLLALLESDYMNVVDHLSALSDLDCATVRSSDFSTVSEEIREDFGAVVNDIRLIQEYHFTAQIHIEEVAAAAAGE